MDYRPHDNGHSPFPVTATMNVAELAVGRDVIIAQEDTELFEDESGRKFRRIRTVRKVARRTFLTGKLRGKYWGYPADKNNQRKGPGDFFDITIYESEVFVDKYDIKTDQETSYQELVTGFSRKLSCQSQEIHFEQFAENILVVRAHESAKRYKIDLYEPALFNPKLLHGMHQSHGAEVFGTIESHICGYLVDSVIQVEETVEEVEERPPLVTTIQAIKEPENRVAERVEGKWEWLLRNKESILLLLLFSLALLLLLTRFPLAAVLVAVGVSMLLFRIPAWRSRLPWWILVGFILLFGLLLWDSLKSYPPVIQGLSSVRSLLSGSGSTTGGGQTRHSGPQSAANPTKSGTKPASAPKPVIVRSMETDSASQMPRPADKSVGGAVDNLPDKTANNPASFEGYLSRGLKAVEDEEYELANHNFRQAARLSPGHPRLRELAASYKAVGDQKCEQFTQGNAKHLSYIPNNYYQYAASLTQTVPLKCD